MYVRKLIFRYKVNQNEVGFQARDAVKWVHPICLDAKNICLEWFEVRVPVGSQRRNCPLAQGQLCSDDK